MNEVKNIPILRFPKFNEVWNQFKLKDVSKYSNGGSFENDVNEHGRYELVTLKSINTEGNLVSSGRYIDKDVKTLQEGTLVMILSEQAPGLLGMTAIIPCDNKYVLNQRVAEIRPTNEINSFFLSSVINVNQRYFSKQGAGMKVQNISKPNVEKFEFYIPSLYEQQKIGDFLTSIDKRIELLKKKKTLLETYKKGVMKKIFNQEIRFKDDNGSDFPDWEEKKVKDVFRVTRGNVLSVNQMTESENLDYRYPVYSSQTKNKGIVGYFNEFLFQDSLTWTTDGANAGEVNFRKGKFYCTNVCGVLISENGFANECISNLINSVSKRYVSYVGNPKLMNGVMAEIKLTFPSIKEQEKISNFLSSIDNQIELLESQINKSKTWKKGLLQKMFV